MSCLPQFLIVLNNIPKLKLQLFCDLELMRSKQLIQQKIGQRKKEIVPHFREERKDAVLLMIFIPAHKPCLPNSHTPLFSFLYRSPRHIALPSSSLSSHPCDHTPQQHPSVSSRPLPEAYTVCSCVMSLSCW